MKISAKCLLTFCFNNLFRKNKSSKNFLINCIGHMIRHIHVIVMFLEMSGSVPLTWTLFLPSAFHKCHNVFNHNPSSIREFWWNIRFLSLSDILEECSAYHQPFAFRFCLWYIQYLPLTVCKVVELQNKQLSKSQRKFLLIIEDVV